MFNCDEYVTLVMCSTSVYSLQKHPNVADLLTPHPTKMTHLPWRDFTVISHTHHTHPLSVSPIVSDSCRMLSFIPVPPHISHVQLFFFFPMSLAFTSTRADVFPSWCGPCYTRGWSAKAGRPNMAMLVSIYIVSGYFHGEREEKNSSHRDQLNLKTKSISHLALLMIILSPSRTLTFLDLHFGLLDFWDSSAYNQLEQTDIYKEPCIYLLMFIHYLSSILLFFPGIT